MFNRNALYGKVVNPYTFENIDIKQFHNKLWNGLGSIDETSFNNMFDSLLPQVKNRFATFEEMNTLKTNTKYFISQYEQKTGFNWDTLIYDDKSFITVRAMKQAWNVIDTGEPLYSSIEEMFNIDEPINIEQEISADYTNTIPDITLPDAWTEYETESSERTPPPGLVPPEKSWFSENWHIVAIVGAVVLFFIMSDK